MTHRPPLMSLRPILIIGLITSALLLPSIRAQAAPLPSASAMIEGVRVTTTLSRRRVKREASAEFQVEISTAEGEARPTAVRARLGMPDHGHWITEELRLDLGDEPLRFPASFPMTGRYRFRIWLELPSGEQKTAVDFQAPGGPITLEVVP